MRRRSSPTRSITGRTAGAASHKEVVKFYRDLAAEQAAYHALKEYRDTHVPKEACP